MNSIRNKYQKYGVEEYYKKHSENYTNPHYSIVKEHLDLHNLTPQTTLDLCCGSGEVSNYLRTKGFLDITGCDPFTHSLYKKTTGLTCLEHDFKHLATIGLREHYNLIVCSFALHLCPNSLLHNLLYNLSVSCNNLLIISPNKKPHIDSFFSLQKEIKLHRVQSKLYNSLWGRSR